jgi:hypothetical protein
MHKRMGTPEIVFRPKNCFHLVNYLKQCHNKSHKSSNHLPMKKNLNNYPRNKLQSDLKTT